MMTVSELRESGFNDAIKTKGKVMDAFDKLALAIDALSFQRYTAVQMEFYVQGFKSGFRAVQQTGK